MIQINSVKVEETTLIEKLWCPIIQLDFSVTLVIKAMISANSDTSKDLYRGESLRWWETWSSSNLRFDEMAFAAQPLRRKWNSQEIKLLPKLFCTIPLINVPDCVQYLFFKSWTPKTLMSKLLERETSTFRTIRNSSYHQVSKSIQLPTISLTLHKIQCRNKHLQLF